MKDRLPALDGLRGLAALAVALSHSGYSPINLINIPIVLSAYNTLAVGPNSVQILFVLSGFLMAFLYPTMPSAATFIQKRYARILPIYTTIVTFLWISLVGYQVLRWYMQIPLLILLALGVHFGWKLLHTTHKWVPIGKILFYTFVFVQSGMLFVNLFITPHFIQADVLQLHGMSKNILFLLSNLTLTTPFAQDVIRLSGVFWSLAPEMLFYILYPFIVLPLIHVSKKWGYIVSLIVILAVTKILFDLDSAVIPLGALQSMNIARASGFVAGVTIGTIYQTKGLLWQKIEKIVKHPLMGIIALLLFIGIQWGDGAIRNGQSIGFMNTYYLISSWVIALLILTAIIPKTITHRIFSTKVLVFFGLISYSMYLIHTQVWEWMAYILAPVYKVSHIQGINSLLYVLLGIAITIALSAFLFYTVEYLYFSSKKKVLETTLASASEKINREFQTFTARRITLTAIVSSIVLFTIYSGMYSPTFLLKRHTLPNASFFATAEQPLLKKTVTIPFTASNNNLSSVVFDLRYAKSAGDTIVNRKTPASLAFSLLDSQQHIVFTSTHAAYMVEGMSRFPFGIPTLINSKNQQYIAELTLQNGRPDDQVFVEDTPTGFTSIYTTDKSQLVHNILPFLLNKIVYVFTNVDFLFALTFIIFLTIFLPFIENMRRKRI